MPQRDQATVDAATAMSVAAQSAGGGRQAAGGRHQLF